MDSEYIYNLINGDKMFNTKWDYLLNDVFCDCRDTVYNWTRAESETEVFDDHYEVYLKVPGVKKEDLKATVENGFLTIEAPDNDDYKIPTKFKSTWKISDSINAAKIELKLINGILTVILPKKQKTKTLTVKIK